VREGRCRPHGWGASNETEFEIKNPEKAENCAYEKSQAREIGLMQVFFTIPGPLREFTGNQRAVRVRWKRAPICSKFCKRYSLYTGTA